MCTSVPNLVASRGVARIFEWETNRRQVANLHPEYPKNRKSHRICDTSFSILEGTSPPKFVTLGTRPLSPAFDAHGI